MEIVKIVAIGVLVAIVAIILREVKPDLSFMITVAGVLVLLLCSLEPIRSVVSAFYQIADRVGFDGALFRILIKMIGIGYLVQFTAGILADFGLSSVADKLIFCGRLAILVLALPIVETLIGLMASLVELIG